MMHLMRRLYPICRSLTGDGVRETLRVLAESIPLQIHEVPSGTKVFDWTVPDEWNIRDAYIIDPEGRKIVDFKKHNLHVVGYSEPIDATLNLEELQSHLFSLKDKPEAIPYVFSYYTRNWGFCLSHRQRQGLKPGRYQVRIDSSLQPGHLTYADLVIPGKTQSEVLVSTYVCHPSMANNELSGPVVATFLARWLREQTQRRLTYRFVFIPETIGSLTYLSRHLETLQQRVIAGFNLSCLGDERAYSYLPSRTGRTLADRVALNVLRHTDPNFLKYSFLDRGGDERQYCSPGINLPVATLCRSLFRKYPEYHSSLDDLSLVSEQGLNDSLTLLQRCIMTLEYNCRYRTNCLGEPQLGRRNLYGHRPEQLREVTSLGPILDFLAYADGEADLVSIAESIDVPPWSLIPVIELLLKENLIHQLDGQEQAS